MDLWAFEQKAANAQSGAHVCKRIIVGQVAGKMSIDCTYRGSSSFTLFISCRTVLMCA
jgi:hypothetical protein